MILRQPTIQYKRFEKLVGQLIHSAIGLPAGRGLCAPFNNTVSIYPKMVALGIHGLVFKSFDGWRHLLIDMRKRPTHVNELVFQDIADVGNMDTSGIGAGGVWMSTTYDYPNTVWRLEWPEDICCKVVSEKNPKGSITNSDLEMAAIILQ